MNIGTRADVDCSEGHCGHSTRIVVDRSTRKITHVVVRESGLRGTERLVPIGEVASADRDKIVLRTSKAQLSQMQQYKVDVYAPDQTNERGGGSSPGTMWEFITPMPDQLIQGGQRVNLSDFDTVGTHENIEEGEVAATDSSRVEAIDGNVGWLTELVADPDSMVVTHFVMRERQLRGQRDVTIPADAIDYIRDGVIHLGLDKQQIKDLPGTRV